MDDPGLAFALELSPEVADVHLQDGVRLLLVAPHSLHDLLARKDLSGMAHEEQEKLVFESRQLDLAVASAHLPGERVEDNVRVRKGLVRLPRRRRTARIRASSSSKAKGLAT